ncbi:MAG: biotin--[acetyl-CoA-carboxylase] ligase [Chitinophagales bacterium]|nr:biotin--[acetyl-CoA-carboxylase] ligase [Chitinophagales bacterium]
MNTLFTGKFLIHLNEIDSTNSFLKLWLSNNKPIDGAVIMADSQSSGRGQIGTSWQSEPFQNITMSLLYLPKFLPVQKQFDLSICIAYSLFETLKEFLPEKLIEVKWPNDILIDNKKVCGILIENSIQGAILQYSIIGIGLNVLQERFSDLPNASSLKLNGYQGGLEEILYRLLEIIEKNYLLLKAGQSKILWKKYYEVLFGKDNLMLMSDHEQTFYGIVRGVMENGAIQVEETGHLRTFYHKELRFLF